MPIAFEIQQGLPCVFTNLPNLIMTDNYGCKGCLSLFNYFIDMSPTLMIPFFVKKTCLFNKKWTH